MEKILDWKNLKDNVDELRRQGKKIAFTNGCFDILHVGHTRYLRQAREKGDVLILALNSDTSVRRIKGEKRPLIPQNERAELLSCLEFVDYVTLFDESTPLNLILYLKPDVLIKGGDWPEDQVVGRREVLSWGGTVSIIPEIPGASTTNIVDKILAVYRDKL
ncbi:MAG: D-glycero-beta-D-manno-heptose 1-phosphate adenylyltransferase [Syntrophus sp. (in: bacteria)]|nr:D-glycero-beta-D-manno-heptose 1-phosphate adenylyltransferase [Syntrophus sp. (in: bacteria)]